MEIKKIILVAMLLSPMYSNAKPDMVFFKPSPSFFNTPLIDKENFLDDIKYTCPGLKKCYPDSEEDDRNYQKQCLFYKLQTEEKKLFNVQSKAVVPFAKRLLLDKNENFSIFLEWNKFNDLSRTQFIIEKNSREVDSFIFSQQTAIDKLSNEDLIRWQEDNYTSNDESFRFIDKKSWSITKIGIYHEECDRVSPVYKKHIKIDPNTGKFYLAYFEFWYSIYGEDAKYHLDFSITNQDIKIQAISGLDELYKQSIKNCGDVLDISNNTEIGACQTGLIYHYTKQVEESKKILINYIKTLPNQSDAYEIVLDKNQKAWIDYKNTMCLFPLLNRLPEYSKDITDNMFLPLVRCIGSVSNSNRHQLQKQLSELTKQNNLTIKIQKRLENKDLLDKPVLDTYEKAAALINKKQTIFQWQSLNLLEKSKNAFKDYRETSCLLEAANYDPVSKEYKKITQDCIERLNKDHMDILNGQLTNY